jgi:D-xylose reductase
MEELVKEGLVRHIGVSNVGCVKIIDVIKYAKIRPSVLQVEMHPFLTQDKLLRFTHMQGIQVMAYSNFGSLSYVQLGMATDSDTCLLSAAILEPASKYNKTPA